MPRKTAGRPSATPTPPTKAAPPARNASILRTPASSVPHRAVSIANHHRLLKLDRRAVIRVIAVLEANLQTLRVPPSALLPGELSLVFLTDQSLAQLHADFLDDPSATDVITFSGDAALGVAGEICVSVDAAIRVARQTPPRGRILHRSRGSSSSDGNFAAELTLYLVHGWLHLAGYDDLAPRKKRLMRQAEARAMELLRDHHAIPRFICAS